VKEATSTALLLFAVGVLLIMSALVSRITRRTGLPIPLLFLAVGMIAGEQGLGGIPFDDYRLALRLGLAALALILFDGGLNTAPDLVRRWYAPAMVLATVGVLLTATLVALAARLFGFSWGEAALVGAVISSTDAAAVFSALRGSGVQLKRRVGITLELESGLNDAMAVILTVMVTGALATGGALSWSMLTIVPIQLGVGALFGFGVGFFSRFILARVRLSVGGLYPVLTVGLALLAFALSTLFHGSGFLSVFLAAIVIGSAELPYHAGLLRIHDALAWFAQVAMFLLLGLLVYPASLAEVALPGIGLGLAHALVARPLSVALCLAPFRFSLKETVYVGSVGLLGAVPIILVLFPVLAGVRGADRIFNLVFVLVVVNSLVPGTLVRWLTRRLGLESTAPPPPRASLEITSTQKFDGDVLAFHIDHASAVCGATIGELPFPPAAAAMLVVRGAELVAARGATRLQHGDHIYVFCRREDRPLLQLFFGREDRD
jgi:potassium/hydrogen antiporter